MKSLVSDLDAVWRGVDASSLELLGMENHLVHSTEVTSCSLQRVLAAEGQVMWVSSLPEVERGGIPAGWLGLPLSPLTGHIPNQKPESPRRNKVLA